VVLAERPHAADEGLLVCDRRQQHLDLNMFKLAGTLAAEHF
jgi:hypothetical protein